MNSTIAIKRQQLAFVFPGQGSFTDTTLSELIVANPQFANEVTIASAIIRKHFGMDLTTILFPQLQTGKVESVSENFELSQTAIFLVGYFLQKLLLSRGITPDLVMGHSIGEIPALTAAGVFTFEEGLHITCLRTLAVKNFAKTGQMLAVQCEPSRMQQFLGFLNRNDVNTAVINNRDQVVVSGSLETIETIKKCMEATGTSCAVLKSRYPFHSTLMLKAIPIFYESIKNIVCKTPKMPVYSPVLNRFYNQEDNIPELLAYQLFEPVNFYRGAVDVYKHGVRYFVETGGRNALSNLLRNNLEIAGEIQAMECNPKGKSLAEGVEWLLSKLNPSIQPLRVNEPSNRSEISNPPRPVLVPIQAPTAAQKPVSNIPAATNGNTESNKAGEIKNKVVGVYQRMTDYPLDVLDVNADLESELGLDSVKQLEIMSLIFSEFQLVKPEVVEVAKFNSISKVIEFVLQSKGTGSPSPAPTQVQNSTEAQAPKEVTREATREAPKATHGDVQKQILQVYQNLTSYPEDVLELNADLESELGLDSVKQIEVLARIFENFALAKPESFDLSKFNTISKTIAFVNATLAPNAVAAPQPVKPAAVVSITKNEATISKILGIYQEMTNYPLEVLDKNADLESELGLDSVKQLEIISRVFSEFNIPRNEKIETAKINTIEKVCAYVEESLRAAVTTAA